MNNYLLSLLVVSSIAGAQEVSVFDAGNLNANSPYGLNSSEKHILKNQTNINSLSSKVGDMNSLIESINRRLEGLESTYEGDSAKLNSTVLKINELSQKIGQSSDLASNSDAAEIKNVSQQLLNMKSDSEKEMKESINTLKAALAKITTLVNKINSDYVSSSELEKNMQQFITREEFEALKKTLGVKTTQVTPKKTNQEKSSAVETNVTADEVIKENLTAEDKVKLLNDAKKDFDAKNYNSAIPKYEKLVEVNYKPAEGNFYLGEMWYIRKKYDLAISHFKKSAVLYDKAAYMPTLLLHSAISFENTKDKDNAKNFYSTLIDLYPSSSEATIAKKNLSKL
ncbi:tetratricopeptide repeat protein [Arcobacter sp. s6]|uniref:tetratricopeptide repeat protein n=1 Tax=Arcobacter sp. s6 TaxID=3230363 RepID=UPI0034A00846